jgi:hypothetical protein
MERMARRSGHTLAMSSAELANRLSGMEMLYKAANAGFIEAGSDAEFFQYAKAIAQHSAALGELLYGRPLDPVTSEPPSRQGLVEAAREALFHQGVPPDLTLDEMLPTSDSAGRGVALLYHAAFHAAERWAKLDIEPQPKVGKFDVRYLVRELAELYILAFAAQPRKHPSAKSPVVVFCGLAAGALYRRIARQHGISVVGRRRDPLPRLLEELLAIAWRPGKQDAKGTSASGRQLATVAQGGAAKIVDHLRPRRERAMKSTKQAKKRRTRA